MKNLIGAVAVVVIAIPWLLKSLDDGSINLNRLFLNLVGTVQEIITRTPSQWRAPEPRQVQPPAAPPEQEPPRL